MIFSLVYLICLILALFLLSYPLSRWIACIAESKEPPLKWLAPLEKLAYRMAYISPEEEMSAWVYGKALFSFNCCGFAFLLFILLSQGSLPLNPLEMENLPFPLAFNIASSFVTNTNWQSYAGETTLSLFSQMAGLTTQNFLSAATGMASLFVLIRGLTRKESNFIGNFWRDLVRSVLYLLLPLSAIFTLVLVFEGVPQTLKVSESIVTLEGVKQKIPLGPIASQVAIKQLGTNGGGFFNTNSAHPFENPTPLTNFLEVLAILLIPGAIIISFGELVGSRKESYILLFAVVSLWIAGVFFSTLSQGMENPFLATQPIWEGQEVRIGPSASQIWTVSTTATSNGSVNAMISSLSPISGGIALFNMMIGCLIFGGIGVGLGTLLFFVFLTVFLGGLMVGRTPEYLGKKITVREMQWTVLAIVGPSTLILISAGLATLSLSATNSLSAKGPHAITEMLYAFTSAVANNGSAFAGLNSNTTFYNISLALCMIAGRLFILAPMIAVGGLLAKKNRCPSSKATLVTDKPYFGLFLTTVILIIGGLTFLPVLSLGPIIEAILVAHGRGF